MNMQAIGSSSEAGMQVQWRQLVPVLTCLSTVWLSSCAAQSVPEVRTITLQQQWAFNPGDDVSGNRVAGSLGDVSLYLNEGHVQAPFDGELAPSEVDQCALYSTPEIPAYLFRLCGLRHFDYGDRKAGQTLGKGEYLSFATLRKQPDGTWVIVEPAKDVLEKSLD